MTTKEDGKTLPVEIADFKVAKNSAVLETTSLGSCVGIVLYDPVNKIGGLAHILLPDSSISKAQTSSPAKFADTGIRAMIEEMIKLGGQKNCFRAKIAGGANMFESVLPDPCMAIGERNVEAVKKVLAEEKIPIVGEDTGKNYGRTLIFYIETGKVIVKSAQYGTKEI